MGVKPIAFNTVSEAVLTFIGVGHFLFRGRVEVYFTNSYENCFVHIF